MNTLTSSVVIPVLVPGIHVVAAPWFQDVDGRNKSGHDARGMCCASDEGRAR